MEIGLVIVLIGALIFLALFFSALFELTRIPDVLPLVLIGLLLGPVLHIVSPDQIGKVGEIFTVATLIVILLDGGLTLSFSSIRRSMRFGVILTILNFVTIAASTTAVLHYLFDLDWMEGLIVGTILGGICSDVVVPMVDKLGLTEKTRAALLLEATFSDVLCIVSTLGLIAAVKYDQLQVLPILGKIGLTFLGSIAVGIVAAFLWMPVIRRIRHFKNSTLATLAFAFMAYGGVELLGFSGGIAVLSFGITLNNIGTIKFSKMERMNKMKITRDDPEVLTRTEKSFLSEIVFLLKTLFYVFIGISMQIGNVEIILVSIVLTLVSLIIRIPVVWLSLDRSIKKKDAFLASVLVPRGLAAAVLASIVIQSGIEVGPTIRDIIYASILVSIVATSLMAFLVDVGFIRQPYAWVFKKFGMQWEEA